VIAIVSANGMLLQIKIIGVKEGEGLTLAVSTQKKDSSKAGFWNNLPTASTVKRE
jgi:hypothetical protein